jgi:hypothetical protein
METKTSVIWGATYLRVLPLIAAMAISVPVPAGATNVSEPSAVYNPDRDSIDVFVIGDDGNLYDNYWDGSAWQWAPLGAPLGHTVRNPSAVYHPTLHSMVVFVIGNNNHLFEWNGVGSGQWYDRGPAPGGGGLSPPSAVYRSGTNQILVFVVANDVSMYVWNGSAWNLTLRWDHGIGLGSVVYQYDIDRVIAFSNTSPDFFPCSYTCLSDTYWDGNWITESFSPPDPVYLGPPSAVYPHFGWGGHLIAFATGHTGELYDRYWDGWQWSWERQYDPGTNVYAPSAVYQDNIGLWGRIAVFVIGGDGHLYDKYTTDFGWAWEDQQTPSDGVLVREPLSTIFQPTLGRIHVFLAGSDGNLWVKYYDGGWKWQNQGTPQ